MNYHLQDGGRDLGNFSLEELRQRRLAGALTGGELVWCPGMTDWQPLDRVLGLGAVQGSKSNNNAVLVGLAVSAFLGFILITATLGFFASKLILHQSRIGDQAGNDYSGASAVDLADKPVTWNTNSLTSAGTQKQTRDFLVRQFVDGYDTSGSRNPACDTQSIQLIKAWIAEKYGPSVDTNSPGAVALADDLATNPACADPVVLTVAGINSVEWHEGIRRLQLAVKGFENSKYKAFPQFFATVTLADKFDNYSPNVGTLDQSSLKELKESFMDGSLRSEDQSSIGEILVFGWGKSFFERNGTEICSIMKSSGKSFQWLDLVLEGENQITEAWRARGNGYANGVSAEGWRGFHEHLAEARKNFIEAWKLRPDLPLAPDRMMTVSLGDSDLAEMRLWFDRTVAVQVDYPDAWSEMRWGLRPRWNGNQKAMRAFGIAAVNTGRFDTDVPRKLLTVIRDIEEERGTLSGENIYGEDDIWPYLRQMYEGYIAEPSQSANLVSWRDNYATVAFLAGKYDVARMQLEALNWQPNPADFKGWDVDLSLMPLEVAARTGPDGEQVKIAESDRIAGDISQALKIYTDLSSETNADDRTEKFARCRSASLQMEQSLKNGGWVDFLPQSDNDPNWEFVWGKPHRLSDGALEVESGENGHFLYSRARVGEDFEVRGQFEVVHSSTKDFQAGLIMGMPDCDTRFDTMEWFGFRMKQTSYEGKVASFSVAWTKNQFSTPAPINAGTNTFYFRWHDLRATAVVNGKTVFSDVERPRIIGVNADHFLLGLGSFNNNNETIVRYRNVQIHSLSSQSFHLLSN